VILLVGVVRCAEIEMQVCSIVSDPCSESICQMFLFVFF
jgi:hypothetical protein